MSTPGTTSSTLGARRWRVTPSAEASDTAVTRARPARSSRAAARSSDSSMPWTVVISGVRGSAIATISIDRTDCVCAMSGRNSLAIERSERNQSGNVRAVGRPLRR